jgi:hypothetical protein
VLRSVSTATRSLALYPPTSPIPRQTIEAAMTALEEFFGSGASQLKLAVAREGFAYEGEPVATNLVVSLELANTLRDHGVAQISILPNCTSEDLLGFLSVVSRSPEEVRAEGGIGAVVEAMSVYNVLLTDVQLVTLDQTVASTMDSETLMLEIADNPAKLGSWFSTVASGDRSTFRSSIKEYADVTGDQGVDSLAEMLSGSLSTQPANNRDALLTLALEPGPGRELTELMFSMMDAQEIASTILDGKFGRNMLSLSSALANLPFDQVADSVSQEVISMLPLAGHGPGEAAFLDHMLEVRDGLHEEPLVEADRTFRTIVQAGSISENDVARAREVTTAATAVLDTVGVRTMFTLLDTQTEYDRFCASADSLAAMVPRLLERKEFKLAAQVLDELSARETVHPEWAGLSQHMQQILSAAVGPDSAGALVRGAVENRELVPLLREILRFSGNSNNHAIAAEAVALKADGLEVAEEILGRQLVDSLFGLAAQAQWFQLGPLVERFAADGSPRALAAIESLLARPEEQARREVVNALAAIDSPALLPLLGSALRDPSEEVATLAARAIAKSSVPGTAALLAGRLGELDVDNTDFARARELIGALARTPDPAADEALQRLASRRAIIKRGHFAEVQQLVAQAISVRGRGGAHA